MSLWRAVDDKGKVEILVQSRRNKARKRRRKLLRKPSCALTEVTIEPARGKEEICRKRSRCRRNQTATPGGGGMPGATTRPRPSGRRVARTPGCRFCLILAAGVRAVHQLGQGPVSPIPF